MMRTSTARPTVMASGLFALDVIVEPNGHVMGSTLGGSAGNVLSILSSLGWGATPVTRVGQDSAGRALWNELVQLGADTQCVHRTYGYETPVIFQHLLPPGSAETHRFSFSCPHCGRHVRPNFAATETMHARAEQAGSPDVFFLDRPTPLGVKLAERYAASDTLVVFEPSAFGNDPDLFRRAIRAAHIVKYSDERLSDLKDYRTESAALEIQTLGKRGLRFRAAHLGSRWQALKAYSIPETKDAAGAGDWCTAGFLFNLWREGSCQVDQLSIKRIREALSFGQALASFNCMTVGARGLLNKLSPDNIVKLGLEMSAWRLGYSRYRDLQYNFEYKVAHACWSSVNNAHQDQLNNVLPCCDAEMLTPLQDL